ncbi:MAG TPA: hypothetical protein DCZ94_08235 [Lentisphaeria bacterium]|nr:MAG: hypothetical protein A2X48_19715 [Lentisphaerae bacterium GWF2_49_21]HBC86925.1 hypothetical protein [Lentisphaeria bacterium]
MCTQAWEATWSRFYRNDTHLFYDYLSSYEPGHELAHLPAADEVRRQYPNIYGYGTGMEDCMISAGVMLCLITDRYAVTGDETLRELADAVFQGIQLCATAHGIPGFLARAVCAEDLKGIYINSSRDQYTHAVHGLWHYFRSPLCGIERKAEIGTIVSAIADRMIRNVTPENDYDSLRADGTRDTHGISRMWNVKGHEAARLPMLYAAAWDVTGRQVYHEMYRRYLEPAVEQSLDFEGGQPTYALLQMQCSLELLSLLEQDKSLKKKMHGIMKRISKLCAGRAINADCLARGLDLTMVGPDWRKSGGLVGEYRKVWYCIRESGEAALAQLIGNREKFSRSQQELLAQAITRIDCGQVSSGGIFYLQAAYWKGTD